MKNFFLLAVTTFSVIGLMSCQAADDILKGAKGLAQHGEDVPKGAKELAQYRDNFAQLRHAAPSFKEQKATQYVEQAIHNAISSGVSKNDINYLRQVAEQANRTQAQQTGIVLNTVAVTAIVSQATSSTTAPAQ